MRTTFSISLSVALAFSLALVACADAPTSDPGATLAAFELTDRATAKLAYASKTDAEKVVLWSEHFERETGDTRFPANKAAIIADVVANLPTLVAGFDADLAARAEAAFSDAELATLFELPGRWPGDAIHDDTGERFADPGCDTRWCTCGLPPHPIGLVCNGAHCSSTNSGCGWFGQQSCTRECYIDDVYE